MNGLETLLLLFYGLVLAMLVIFGLHKYFLIYLYWEHRKTAFKQEVDDNNLPFVTIQLPLYNEQYVIARLIDSICNLDYPKELFEVQVLDDSTDETQTLGKDLVEKYQGQGFDIQYIHRTDRTGFKAGALDKGLQIAKGDFLAIFDADFVPNPDFLKKTVGYFQNKEIGMVQARWGHINRHYSMLTRIQSLFLDGHFVIEHIARNRSGRFFNFNGTAGLWRKQAIFDAGGWQHDTLTEDLDLSYRAQIAGWRFIYVHDVVAPAELPVEVNAYKSQQHRWAKGSVQTAKKMLPVLWRSKAPLFIKVEGTIHLTSNFTYLFMTIPALFMPVILDIQFERGWDWMVYVYLFVFFSASLSVIIYYLVAQIEGTKNWKSEVLYVPILMAVGIGLSINNARAVLEGIFNYTTEFKRTPKYRIENKKDDWNKKKYRSELNLQPFVELLLGCYFTIGCLNFLERGELTSIPFFMLFQFGFLYIGLMSLMQNWRIRLAFRQVRHFLHSAFLALINRML